MGEPLLRDGLLLGIGSPLLDLSANMDEDFLLKYDLKANDAILAEEKHLPMYEELANSPDVTYIVGGSCQNTMRVAQWIVKRQNTVAFMGSVGKDKFGKILENKAKEAGVLVAYQIHDTVPTGTCAVVITDNGHNRSLCAHLCASKHFTVDFFLQPESQKLINNARFFYISGFFLPVSPESVMYIAKHACRNDKYFCMNLSAPYLCHFYKEPMLKALPFVDILFSNNQEALAFADEHLFGTDDIEDIALRIKNFPKENKSRSRIVIVTQGRGPVICATENGIMHYPVVNLTQEEIVDTNGAGDAFVGGFLAQFIQGKGLDICIRCGIYAATEVIKQSGCSFPKHPNFST
ncbi:uncharacterized protein LOC129224866 [Uloborus diversus]|uniref:uncharacterized protein LOC129224866 n=1 Tax=Uloborus diversus TaxID=327109 RepID=UPI0024095A59|nr:uncharacterized protein LOC129224866 [Uloborus diversus]